MFKEGNLIIRDDSIIPPKVIRKGEKTFVEISKPKRMRPGIITKNGKYFRRRKNICFCMKVEIVDQVWYYYYTREVKLQLKQHLKNMNTSATLIRISKKG